jgi:hypothetical protein
MHCVHNDCMGNSRTGITDKSATNQQIICKHSATTNTETSFWSEETNGSTRSRLRERQRQVYTAAITHQIQARGRQERAQHEKNNVAGQMLVSNTNNEEQDPATRDKWIVVGRPNEGNDTANGSSHDSLSALIESSNSNESSEDNDPHAYVTSKKWTTRVLMKELATRSHLARYADDAMWQQHIDHLNHHIRRCANVENDECDTMVQVTGHMHMSMSKRVSDAQDDMSPNVNNIQPKEDSDYDSMPELEEV